MVMKNKLLQFLDLIESGINPDDFYDMDINAYFIRFQGNANASVLAKYTALGYVFEFDNSLQMLVAQKDSNIKIVFTL